MKSIQTTIQFELSCQHRLENPNWSAQKNIEHYGICYQRHGHHFGVHLVLEAPITENFNIAFDRKTIENIFTEQIRKAFDAQYLNEIVPNTSGESICVVVLDKMSGRMPKGVVLKAVQIQETRKNWFATHV